MKRLALITAILGSALALVPVASAMVLLDGTRSHDTTAATGLVQHSSPATLAVIERSRGLADYYGANAVTLHVDTLGGKGAPFSGSVSTGDSGFDWGNGLAVTLAALLVLAIAATTVTRRKHRLSF